MRFQFIRLFFEAAAAEGAGGAAATEQQKAEAEKAKAESEALTAKLTALETQNAELAAKIAELAAKKDEGKGEDGKEKNKKKDDAEVPAWAKTLVEQNEKLATQLASFQTEKATNTRKTLLETELKAIEGLPESYRDEVIDNFNGRTFKDDAEFETFKKNKVEAAKKLGQTESANSISIFTAPKVSASGGDGKKVSSAMASFLESKKPSAPSKN